MINRCTSSRVFKGGTINIFSQVTFHCASAASQIMRCLAAPPASIHEMPAAQPSTCDNQKCLQIVQMSPGEQSHL